MEEEIETIVKQLVEATSEQLAAWEEQEMKEEQKERVPLDLHTKTILAVDDNERNLMVLKHLMRGTTVIALTASAAPGA